MSLNECSTRCVSPEPTRSIPGTVCVEGNIGSGKSTLLAGLEEAGYWVAQEPVKERWGKHLGTLYSDQKRWGFTFQVEVVDWYKHLVQLLQRTSEMPAVGGGNPPIKIVERSPVSTYQIFGKNLRQQGNLNEWEMKLLGKIVESWAWVPEHTFYVKTPYRVAYGRVNERNRSGEEDVPLDLIRQLEIRHEAFISSRFCGKVHILDGRLSKADLVAQAISKLDAIQKESDNRIAYRSDPSQTVPIVKAYSNDLSNNKSDSCWASAQEL